MSRITRIFGCFVLLSIWSSAAQARYLQADPIGLDGGPNPYVYADNNPVMHVDPDGLQFLPYSRSLNRTTVHPMRISDETALALNTPYVVGAVMWGGATYGMPALAGAINVTGPIVAAGGNAAIALGGRCSAEAAQEAMKQCLVAGLCYGNDDTQWRTDHQRLDQISSDSRSGNPIIFRAPRSK